MEPNTLSDQQLLAILIGAKTAEKRYAGSLTTLFLGEYDDKPHPKLAAAFELVRRVLKEEVIRGPVLTSSTATHAYLKAHFIGQQYESFITVFLDSQHRVLRIDELFRGTVDGAAVYPREVVRLALRCNAAACIFAHNHPSGVAEPSTADRNITSKLKNALALVDIRTLDHVVVGADVAVSFAERGIL